jgi:catalase
MLSSLVNVSRELAAAVAEGLGLNLPEAMPKALPKAVRAEIESSPALSLMAHPGDGSIVTRKVAILIAQGVQTGAVEVLLKALLSAGAVVRLLGIRLGAYAGTDGVAIEVDATLENSPSVLFDGLVLPAGITGLAGCGQAIEFIREQYRHCKTVLALGDAAALLIEAGIEPVESAPGLIVANAGAASAKAFIDALGRHRHPGRDQSLPSGQRNRPRVGAP